MTTITWDTGTAYDFFISLYALHHAADIGLRPSWAAGVRQRISPPRREFLERFFTFGSVPLQWIRSLPEPKDAITALHCARDLPAPARLVALTFSVEPAPQVQAALAGVAERGTWSQADETTLREHPPHRTRALSQESLTLLLQTWAQAERAAQELLQALNEYYEAFFMEEENRIRPALESGMQAARARSQEVTLEDLLEELSHGIRFEDIGSVRRLVLAPSYWMTPLVFHTRPSPQSALIVFGVRP